MQNIKQFWFPGVHADIGGGYPEEESGLSKFPLHWMIREAKAHGLKINSAMRNHLVLGRPRAGAKSALVKPAPTAKAHDSLTWGWRPLEWIPKSAKWREWPRREMIGFYIPQAEPRLIQIDSVVPCPCTDRPSTECAKRPIGRRIFRQSMRSRIRN
jgi:hypothetical protein